jgi:hypothetical protein
MINWKRGAKSYNKGARSYIKEDKDNIKQVIKVAYIDESAGFINYLR